MNQRGKKINSKYKSFKLNSLKQFSYFFRIIILIYINSNKTCPKHPNNIGIRQHPKTGSSILDSSSVYVNKKDARNNKQVVIIN